VGSGARRGGAGRQGGRARLPKGLEIHGRIVDETGAVVPGAVIHAELRSETWLGSMSGGPCGRHGRLRARAARRRGVRPPRSTDEAGSALPSRRRKAGTATCGSLPKTTTVSLTVVDYQDRPSPARASGVAEHGGGGASLAWCIRTVRGTCGSRDRGRRSPGSSRPGGPRIAFDLSELRLRAWTPADGRIRFARLRGHGHREDAEGKPFARPCGCSPRRRGRSARTSPTARSGWNDFRTDR
jgi:hypothetical protein